MQGAMLMLMALSGLGCQNKIGDSGELPAAVRPIASPAANPAPGAITPPPYPQYSVPGSDDTETADTTYWGVLRSTLCSFVLGHDPDVMTAREIEASAYGYGDGNQNRRP
jgi:hypothetical protein